MHDDDFYDEITDEIAIPEEEVERPAAWLVSFGDVTALMLTFFVMLFSMSHIPSEKWDTVIALISTRINPVLDDQPKATNELNIASVSLVNALPTAYLNRIFAEKLARDPVLSTARVTELDGQVVISLPSESLFQAGLAALRPEASEAVFRLGGAMSQIGNRIDVQGHTDPDPPRAAGFESNWALSLARALNVSKALKSAGYPGRLTAVGLADSHYKHLDPNLPEERRFELSRRVDLVILPDADGQ
ncbi:OmpA family protein [Marivibrio halodurans]|uniref:OmpA family protein n=1 Tax=Marivibrio halodurans TaxID=2039722 RepID=A0A8J7SMH0_9PROT|nr:flagellar motor protein MotB [Marivibrio halodurans]MBP5856941.1 OmpA family protein [Marivibrio halodurans]